MITVTFVRSIDADLGGALIYTVLQNGMPLMANTTQPERAMKMLERTLERLKTARRHHTVDGWDGERGVPMPVNGPDIFAHNALHQIPEEL